ncbi:MAG TPA: hypothetical protein VMF06_01200, partial [Candidatus Limnocylindria bacterium]|nr:hypothetical protein [Candidatus Limnocylindria bacterium]
FFGIEKPVSAVDAEELSNIFKWGNEATRLVTYRIKQGTTFYRGRIAGGAGNQIYINNPKGAGVELLSSEPLPISIVNPAELPAGSLLY